MITLFLVSLFQIEAAITANKAQPENRLTTSRELMLYSAYTDPAPTRHPNLPQLTMNAVAVFRNMVGYTSGTITAMVMPSGTCIKDIRMNNKSTPIFEKHLKKKSSRMSLIVVPILRVTERPSFRIAIYASPVAKEFADVTMQS